MAPATAPLSRQNDLFPEAAIRGYLNGASRAPQLKSVHAAALHTLHWRAENNGMPIANFFEPVAQVRRAFAHLINCDDPDRIALIPAASYGLATAAKNLPFSKGQEILVVEDQFPSNYYPWQRLAKDEGGRVRTVSRPTAGSQGSWSDRILESIGPTTAAVAIGHIHWADGTPFDLVAIRERTEDVGAWLIIDGTQSVGALPFDVAEIRPDALVCGAYKWLMGPYGTGLAYFGPRLDDGKPIEENWINRKDSDDFPNLVKYQDAYRPKAARYSTGQHSSFVHVAMQLAALDQVNAWAPARVQGYCKNLWVGIADDLAGLGIELPEERAQHLVGLSLPGGMATERLPEELAKRGLVVSFRGDSVRVSPHVYNGVGEMGALAEALKACS